MYFPIKSQVVYEHMGSDKVMHNPLSMQFSSLNPTGVYIRLIFTSREHELHIYTPTL